MMRPPWDTHRKGPRPSAPRPKPRPDGCALPPAACPARIWIGRAANAPSRPGHRVEAERPRLAIDRELSGWRVTMRCPGAWVRFQRRKVADSVAAVLTLLLHDHAQAKADRACFLRVLGRGQAWAYPFQVVIGEPV